MRIRWFSMVRVTGLLLVLLYHFYKDSFPGGFIGVDIFFTFSGYLITALLLDEYLLNGKIDIVAFLRRRFYRIVPPLVMMILVVLPLTFLVRRDFTASIGSQIAAALGFTTNIYEILTGSSYETQFVPHLFVHTWSLAIEVHFYLFWGLLLWLFSKRNMKPGQFRGMVYSTSLVLFVLSFLSMFVRAFLVENTSLIYFSSLHHSFPFFLGAMFATTTGIQQTTQRFQKSARLWTYPVTFGGLLGSLALLVLLSIVLDFNNRLTYLFGFVLASLFSAVMIYSARVLSDKTGDMEEPVALTFLSDISYGLYLFHWPFYIIFKQLFSNGTAVALTMLLSVMLSAVSYYILEPYLQGKVPYVMKRPLDLTPYRQWLGILAGVLTTVMLVVSALAPRVGAFETGLLVDSLNQAQTNMNRTHTLAAGDASALGNVLVIGDSVALRSSEAFTELLPEVQLDAAISRNFVDSYEIFTEQIDNGSLAKIVVLAIGVNAPGDYKASLQQFIKALPKGHRLVLVTGYNAADAKTMAELRKYELSLAKTHSYVEIADWHKAASKNSKIWNGTDGVHYSIATSEGADLYVTTIKKAIARVAKASPKE